MLKERKFLRSYLVDAHACTLPCVPFSYMAWLHTNLILQRRSSQNLLMSITTEEEVSLLKEKLQFLTYSHLKPLPTEQSAQEENCSSAPIKDGTLGTFRPFWTLEKSLQLYGSQKCLLWLHCSMQNNLLSSEMVQNRKKSVNVSVLLLSSNVLYCTAAAQQHLHGGLSWHDSLPL